MYLEGFLKWLEEKKKMSRSTVQAYRQDVSDFFRYAKDVSMGDVADVTNTDIVSYLLDLKGKGKSASTVNRRLASLRTFYNYMTETGQIHGNPTIGIKSPKVEKKDIEFLTLEEMDRVLAAPGDSDKGKRDKAILELMYATGIRVNEVIGADVEDVNLRIGFFTCPGDSGKARIIPMGRPAREALEEYIYNVRKAVVEEAAERGEEQEKALFLNYYGKRMTRQGLWKILKEYEKKADIDSKLTPHLIRNSFAVHMVQNGADIKSIQELLGHEDITSTQIYLSIAKNRIKDVYDKAHPRAL